MVSAVQPPRSPSDVRRASGLPNLDVLHHPERVTRVRQVVARAAGSAVLDGLVRLAGRVAASPAAQLSLLSDEQVATVVRSSDATTSQATSSLADSLCTITVLSGDVLVAGDTRSHPWLCDLPLVTGGSVGAYLGVPLPLRDATVVGALCVFGPQPRVWSDRDVGLTCDVADVVALELQRLVDP